MLGIGKNRRAAILAAIGGAVALGAIALGGVVWAQTGGGGSGNNPPTTGQNQRQAMMDQFLNDLATNLNVPRSTLDSALQKTANAEVDRLQQNGTLTADQANNAKQAIANGQYPFFGGRFGGKGAGAFSQLRTDLQACSQAAMTAAQSTQGQTPQQRGAAVATALKPCLDQAVSAQHIMAQQEQNILDQLNSGRGPFLHMGGRGHNRPANGSGSGQPSQSSQPSQ